MNVKLVDCTLRDGGYYNAWDYAPELPQKLVGALDQSGVDLVELGYKSIEREGYFGLFRYCSESQLSWLKKYPNLEFAFMLDVKEFLGDGVNVDSFIPPRLESIFSYVRLATTVTHLKPAVEMANHLHSKGYRTTINLMGYSLLNRGQIAEALKQVQDSSVDVFYFADSFGSLKPKDIRSSLELIRQHYDRSIGVHTHDNQGLAFANTLEAIDAGVEYLDATVTGMGRGAGNLKLEQLLLALYFQYDRKDLNAYALLDVIEQDFTPMRQKYDWGWDFAYMVSGLTDVHPTYCQKLKSSHQYTLKQVSQILSDIPPEDRNRFRGAVLEDATNRTMNSGGVEAGARSKLAPYQPKGASTVLIAARGPSLKTHLPAVKAFLEKEKPELIECNHTGLLEGDRTVAVLNQARLSELHSAGLDSGVRCVVSPNEFLEGKQSTEKHFSFPCEIRAGTVDANSSRIQIPSFVVGMYAVGLALLAQPKRVFLVGFDGFGDARDLEMQDYWNRLRDSGLLKGIEFGSLLPSHYDLPQTSIYRFLD